MLLQMRLARAAAATAAAAANHHLQGHFDGSLLQHLALQLQPT
jgi:hypothetical protein